MAGPFQPEFPWPEGMAFVVAQHDVQRFAQQFQLRERIRLAHVAQVPDLIGLGESLRQAGRHPVVRVGDDGDADHLAAVAGASGT